MITKEQKRLIAIAKQMKTENSAYKPSKEELQAIDAYQIEQEKKSQAAQQKGSQCTN